jgi:polyhydroxyalkanoate synthesis regulator phasin
MFETLDKLMLAGLGALAMTRERAEEIFDDYVARGQAERSSRKQFVDDLMGSAQRARADLGDMVARHVREAVAHLNLATREDIARLEAKLDRILTPTPR